MSIRKRNIVILSTLAVIIFFFAGFGSDVLAQGARAPGYVPPGEYVPLSPLPSDTGRTSINTNDPAGYFTNMLAILIGVAGVLAVIAIMVYGLQYMLSTSEGKKSSARAGITGVVFGLFIIFLSYVGLLVINPDLLSLRFFDRLRGVVGETVPDVAGARQQEFLDNACYDVIGNSACRIDANRSDECEALGCSLLIMGRTSRGCSCPNASPSSPPSPDEPPRVQNLGICVEGREVRNNSCQMSNERGDEADICVDNGCEVAQEGSFSRVSFSCDCSNALPPSQQERFCSVSDQQFGVSYPDLDSCEEGREADVEFIEDEIAEKEDVLRRYEPGFVLSQCNPCQRNESGELDFISQDQGRWCFNAFYGSDDSNYERKGVFTRDVCEISRNLHIESLETEIEDLKTERDALNGSPCESGEQCNQ